MDSNGRIFGAQEIELVADAVLTLATTVMHLATIASITVPTGMSTVDGLSWPL